MAATYANRSTTQSTKPSELAAQRRLNLLNRFRDANKTESDIAYYAAQLAGFTQDAIDAACAELEREEVDKFKPWPPVQRFQELCRKHTRAADTEWTLARYRDAWYLDKWIDEQIASGKSREDAVGRLDDASRAMWLTFKNQTLAHTIQIPVLWCIRCRGEGLIPVWEQSPNPEVTTPVCRRMQKCQCREGR